MAEPTNLDTRPAQPPARRISASISAFQGPLPPPEVLEQYGRIVPNGADRIVAMAETAFVALAGVFVYGRFEQRRERERKREELRQAAENPRLPFEP